MIIDYISDLHEDYYYQNLNISHKTVKKFIEPLNPKGEILLVAGDTSESNDRLVQTLSSIQKQFYKKVFFTLGNHELFTRVKYGHYKDKIKELKEILKVYPNLHLLDGTVIKYNGIRIGGTMMWYDGSYKKYFEHQPRDMNKLWRDYMPDYDGIAGLHYFKDIYHDEKNKLNKIFQNLDILITHISPLCHPSFVDPKFKDNIGSSFFTFDGEYFVKNTTAKHWIYGHTHTSLEVKFDNIELHCNPRGYQMEAVRPQFKQIII